MRCRKTVTEKTLAANRLNAKRSTGPRTERGKNTSKFNAVKAGLFAKHVVIPVCDGDDSAQEFTQLLADVQQEFQPKGAFEEFCVVQIAECMWKLRRATRAERGSVRNFIMWEQDPPNACRGAQPYMRALATLEEAKEEIRTTGTLSPTSLEAVLSILGLTRDKGYSRLEEADEELRITGTLSPESLAAVHSILGLTPSEKRDSLTEPKVDHRFLPFLDWMSNMADKCAAGWLSCGDEMRDDYYAIHALPPEAAMNQILRYEKAAQKKSDWALQRLLESQQRRKKSQAPVSVQVSCEP